MRIEIFPEPPEGERSAVEAAIGNLLARLDFKPSSWWRTGIEENLGDDGEEHDAFD